MKRKIYLLLDPQDGGSVWDRVVNSFIIFLIILNTMAVLLETVDSIYQPHMKLFHVFEIFSVAVFSLEYILRLWTITENTRFRQPVYGRLKYMLTPGALIDLFAISPFYLTLSIFFDLRFLRIFRLFRFIRFFKIGRYLKASKIIGAVFRNKKEELVMSIVITFFMIIVSASAMYFIEHDAQPHKFSSIPETMRWSVATLTTVGYGDVYPITIAGKILGSLISILGIGLFALPAGILASGFSDELKHTKKKKYCENCGYEIS